MVVHLGVHQLQPQGRVSTGRDKVAFLNSAASTARQRPAGLVSAHCLSGGLGR